MMKFRFYTIVLLSALLLTGCRKDEDISDTSDIEYPTEIFINTSVKGTVKGNKGNAIPGATIQIGSIIKTADFNGYFHFENISARKSGEIIKIEKQGFRTAYKTFYPQKDAMIYVDIELLSDVEKMVINTGDNKKKIGTEDFSLEIIGNTFSSEGKDFAGNMNIKTLFALPGQKDFFEKQIGDPVGYDKYFKTKGINSYGVIGIEMLQDGGQKIELGTNTIIDLLIKNQIPGAPEELSVWKFNFEKKKWLETQSKAKLISLDGMTYYVAEVNSSGFYNIGQNFDVYEKELTITTTEGINAQFIDVNITSQDMNYKLAQRTSDKGTLKTYLPVNKKSDISITLNNTTFTETIKKDNNTVSIPPDQKLITVKGKLKDCSGNPVSNGYITIFSNNDTIFYDVDQSGSFNCTIVDAKNEQKIRWIASDTKNEINTFIHQATKSNLIDLDEMYVCSEPYAIVEFGEEKYVLDFEMIDLTGNILALVFGKESLKLELVCLDFKGENKYNIDTFPFSFYGFNGSINKVLFPDGEVAISVNEYNKPGMIRGKFKGKGRKNFGDETVRDLKIVYSVRLE